MDHVIYVRTSITSTATKQDAELSDEVQLHAECGCRYDTKHNAEVVFQTFLPRWSDMLDNRFSAEAASTFVGTKTCVELTPRSSFCSI